jgi:hypothetical protein
VLLPSVLKVPESCKIPPSFHPSSLPFCFHHIRKNEDVNRKPKKYFDTNKKFLLRDIAFKIEVC